MTDSADITANALPGYVFDPAEQSLASLSTDELLRRPLMRSLLGDSAHLDRDSHLLASILSPKAMNASSPCGRFSLRVGGLHFLGQPAGVRQPPSSASSSTAAHAFSSSFTSSLASTNASQTSISAFHLVFVLRAHGNAHAADRFYESIVLPISRTLAVVEFVQSGALSAECDTLLKLRERHLPNNNTQSYIDAIRQSWLFTFVQRVVDEIKVSPLRGCLLNVTPKLGAPPITLRWDFTIRQANSTSRRRPLIPYHTLLLLRPVEEILRLLPSSTSNWLEPFIRLLSIRRPLEDTRKKISMSWDQVAGLAEHLMDLGLARPIFPITLESVFVVHPELASLEPFYQYAATLKAKYPNIDLVTALASGRPTRLVDLMSVRSEEARLTYLHIITEMLEREYVAVYNTYLRVKLGSLVKPSDSASCLPALEHHLSKYRDADIQLFWKIYPYCFGQHCIDEVAWMEKLSRKEVVQALEVFRDLLIPVKVVDT